MADRAALVTGASSGIGLAIAHLLGEEAQELRDAGYPDRLRDEQIPLAARVFAIVEVYEGIGDETFVRLSGGVRSS